VTTRARSAKPLGSAEALERAEERSSGLDLEQMRTSVGCPGCFSATSTQEPRPVTPLLWLSGIWPVVSIVLARVGLCLEVCE
jgi:hypothetical protein